MQDNLIWLPAPPLDFREQCRSLADLGADDADKKLIKLATHNLDYSKLELLARAAAKVRKAFGAIPGLSHFRLGLLSNSNTDLVVNAMIASALRHGIDLEIVTGPFGLIQQCAIDTQSPVYHPHCHAILISADYRGLGLQADLRLSNENQVQATMAMLLSTKEAIKRNSEASVIFQTVPAPSGQLFGNLDRQIDGTLKSLVGQLNNSLKALAEPGSGDYLLDVEHLANCLGLGRWHDHAMWNHAKISFSLQFLPLYAEHVARLIGSVRGKSKKCLVLDLDNTLWGGVIGDDGLDGIVIGNGSAEGEAFLDVQRTAKLLRSRGVVLAVSSKNDAEVALRAFREHPEMLLREDDITIFQANWLDKASNLEAIAKALNLNVDSLVLLDDNPAERAQVRSALPGVGVPELPTDPALFSSVLLQAGYFEAVAFTAEDKERSNQYSTNVRREELKASMHDIGSYLRSLNMMAIMGGFNSLSRSRVTQLINKSNQYNLTTKRYTEFEISSPGSKGRSHHIAGAAQGLLWR